MNTFIKNIAALHAGFAYLYWNTQTNEYFRAKQPHGSNDLQLIYTLNK